MKHELSFDVRPYECDMNNHVNNAIYLNYLEYARMEYLEAIGFDYHEFNKLGYAFFVAKAELVYKRPAVMGDRLTITSWPEKTKKASGVFGQIIRQQDGEEVLEARITWACVNSEGKPSRMPEGFSLPEKKDEHAENV
ncbi:MAG: acyl-CoA thioesterase [Spirochaetia bacterium]